MPHPADSLLRVRRLALDGDNVDRFHSAWIGGRPHRNVPVSTVTDHAQPVMVDAVNVLLPHVDQGHVQPTLGQKAPEQTAHGAGADHRNRRFPLPHATLLFLSRRVSDQAVQTLS